MKSFVRFLVVLAALAAGTLARAAVEPPVPVRTVSPEYPEALRASNTTGIVVVACAIDEKGIVTEAKVSKSTNEAFDKSALEAVAKWKFRPATEDGKPVPVKILIPVKFTID